MPLPPDPDDDPDPDWTPRFLAYAAHRGLTPEAVRVADRDQYPGRPCYGFVLWIQERWRAWHESRSLKAQPLTYGVVRGSRYVRDGFDRFIGAPLRPPEQ